MSQGIIKTLDFTIEGPSGYSSDEISLTDHGGRFTAETLEELGEEIYTNYATKTYALQDAADIIKDTHIDWGGGAGQVSADDIPDGAVDGIATLAEIANWNTAFGWGDHGAGGYLQNLLEDLTPQLGGDLYGNAHHIRMADNEVIYFGTGNDAAIYYDGAHMQIRPALVGGGIAKVEGPATFSSYTQVHYANTSAKYIQMSNTTDGTYWTLKMNTAALGDEFSIEYYPIAAAWAKYFSIDTAGNVDIYSGNLNLNSNNIDNIDRATIIDNGWLGLGAGKGRFLFSDAAPDLITLWDADFHMKGACTVDGAFSHDGGTAGFFGAAAVAQQADPGAPVGAGTAGVDNPARDAINGLRTALNNLGLTA